jgi:antitoxin component YwqK of YwqJK toxin-antitoxin module
MNTMNTMDDIYDKCNSSGLPPDITSIVVGYLVEEIKTETESYILFNGKKHGLYSKWRTNKQLEVRCNYSDGKLDGLEEQWHIGGKLGHSCNYVNDKRYGLETWLHSDGRPMFRHNWK